MQNLPNALLISAIGMSLVFIAILLLWGLMEAMVRLTGKSAGKVETESPGESVAEVGAAGEPAGLAADVNKKRRAAAAAVVIALARQQASIGAAPSKNPVNAWQSVLRAGTLSQRAGLFGRKARGR